MHQLSDRDMACDLLYGCKSGATLAMEALMESASPRCRDIFHRIHDEELRCQWQVFELLHRRAEYEPRPADRRDVDSVRQRMEQLRRTHVPVAGQVGYGPGYQPGYNGANRWSDRNWSEPAAVGSAATGTFAGGYESSNVAFEPDQGLPQGTHFESERGWGESGQRYQGEYEAGRPGTTAGVGTTGTQATAAGATYGGRTGWSAGQAGRTTGTQPWASSESTQRMYGDGNWNSPRRY